MIVSYPFEFHILDYTPTNFTVEDIVIWQKLMALDLSMNFGSELDRYELLNLGIDPKRIDELIPPYPAEAVTILSEQDIQHIKYVCGSG